MRIMDEALRAKSKGSFMIDEKKSYTTAHTRTYIVVGTPEARVRELPGLAEDIEAILAYNDLDYAVAYRANPARYEIDADSPPETSLRSVWDMVQKGFTDKMNLLAFFTYKGRERRLLTPSIEPARNTHMLFAGSTGSGKTVCAQAAMATAMMMNSPAVLSFVVCDPNGTGFTFLEKCPHMGRPIAVEDEEILESVRAIHAEMNRRARLRAAPGAFGHLVLVIDEINSQFETNPEVMDLVADIARRGRSKRVHLWLIGQKMTANMPPNIRVNINARVVGRLDSAADAKITCGESSQAHKLQVEQGRFEFTNRKPYGANEIIPVFSFMVRPEDYEFYAGEIQKRWQGSGSFTADTPLTLVDHDDDLRRIAQEAMLAVPRPTPTTIVKAHKAEVGKRLNYDKAVQIWQDITGQTWQKRGQLCPA